MTIKNTDKNISAENEITLFDYNIRRDNEGRVTFLELTRKNFYDDSDKTSLELTDAFYTKKEIDERVRIYFDFKDSNGDPFESINDLPVPGQSNHIYMVPFREDGEETDTGEGLYREYVWAEVPEGSYIYPNDPEEKTYGYESIGSTKIDISDMQVVSNLVDSLDGWGDKVQGGETSDSKYPSEKLVKDTFNLLGEAAWTNDFFDLDNHPTHTSDLINDGDGTVQDGNGNNKPFLIEHQDLSNYLQKSQTAGVVKNNNDIVPIDTTPGGTQNSSSLITSGAVYAEVSKKEDSSNLATVARTGDYYDLNRLPDIPDTVSDLINDLNFVTQNEIDADFSSVYSKQEIDSSIINTTVAEICNHTDLRQADESQKTLENLIHLYPDIEDAILLYINDVHKDGICLISIDKVGLFYYVPDRTSTSNPSGTVQVILNDLTTAIPVSTDQLDNTSGFLTIVDLANYLTKTNIVDNTNSGYEQSPTKVLSAYQGKVLSEKITNDISSHNGSDSAHYNLFSEKEDKGHHHNVEDIDDFPDLSSLSAYTHPTYNNLSTSNATQDLYKIKTNNLGHVIETTKVTASDLPSHTHNYTNINDVNSAISTAITTHNTSTAHGLKTVATTGSYKDLSDKPSISAGDVSSSNANKYTVATVTKLDGTNTVTLYGKDTVYSHPTSNGLGSNSEKKLYSIKTNSLGHIIESSAATTGDLSDSNTNNYQNINPNGNTQADINDAINTSIGGMRTAINTHTHTEWESINVGSYGILYYNEKLRLAEFYYNRGKTGNEDTRINFDSQNGHYWEQTTINDNDNYGNEKWALIRSDTFPSDYTPIHGQAVKSVNIEADVTLSLNTSGCLKAYRYDTNGRTTLTATFLYRY